MRKINLLFVCITLFVGVLFSCKKKKAPSPQELILGKWKIVKDIRTDLNSQGQPTGQPYDAYANYTDCSKNSYVEYFNNGTFARVSNCYSTIFNGVYSLENVNGTLKLRYRTTTPPPGSIEFVEDVLELNSNTMRVKGTQTGTGFTNYIYERTYNKIP